MAISLEQRFDEYAATYGAFSTGLRQLGIDLAFSLGVTLSELITNVSSHAYPRTPRGEVRVVCSDRNTTRLEVDDDGVGISGGAPKGTGPGTQVMDAVAHDLGGHPEMIRLDRGTQAVLHLETACKAN